MIESERGQRKDATRETHPKGTFDITLVKRIAAEHGSIGLRESVSINLSVQRCWRKGCWIIARRNRRVCILCRNKVQTIVCHINEWNGNGTCRRTTRLDLVQSMKQRKDSMNNQPCSECIPIVSSTESFTPERKVNKSVIDIVVLLFRKRNGKRLTERNNKNVRNDFDDCGREQERSDLISEVSRENTRREDKNRHAVKVLLEGWKEGVG